MTERSGPIYYSSGYKYQLKKDFWIQTSITPEHIVVIPFARLLPSGKLLIDMGFSWDGASGPTFDTKSSMVGGLVHDALYRMLQYGILPLSWKERIDKFFHLLLCQDSMWKCRAKVWYRGVQKFGGSSTKHPKKVKTAP